jgi:DNA-binding transcriptional regulator YhcF (GntR family)
MEQETLDSVIAFIQRYLAENNQLSPTVREIAEGSFLSIATIQRCLDILEARGILTRQLRKARSIRLTGMMHTPEK